MENKKWRCVVCGYVHTGPTPPDECPICKAGPEAFELIDTGADDMDQELKKKIQRSLFKISYGLYVVGSKSGDKINAQLCNTFFQITSDPLRVLVALNKNNLTNKYVNESGIYTVSVLGKQGHDLVKRFGYQSGHKVDKFTEFNYKVGETGGPIVEKGCIAYYECKVLPDKVTDAGTHTMFLADVVAGDVIADEEPMTYAYYRETR
ncbi:flavin reductase (DIM6/NTAB) family NADH-FMN oxidoreductase RutF [Desulfitispora alkaliphila]|uniref:flavin reductase family protein n=1 Tax=Desulfitispora alkaliphila TaxID=622674 RepID=UPI003D21839D